jgi:two-component system phosphate regulon sensor histidine kinase PhoR
MIKNPTPQQIAIYASGLLTLSGLVLYLSVETLPVNLADFLRYLIWITVFFFASYFINIFFLKRYIYRKVKVIYKTIHKHKVAPAEKSKTIDVTSNIIDEVEREVVEWADNQAREIEKYKVLEEYRRKFVGDISHELKTPIFNIQGYLETLIDNDLEDQEINIPYLKKAVRNLNRLQTIVEDLEGIARLESGELLLEMQPFDIKKLTEEVFEELEFKAKERKISLEFKEGASSPYIVRADRESVHQVLNNLINNSIKYGVEGGRTKVGFYDMDKYLLIEVADNGIGIPKKHINHVFDRFYRVDKSRSRNLGGSGLGLSIVKHIIEAHKQTVNVRSTPDLGSTFGFTLEKAK